MKPLRVVLIVLVLLPFPGSAYWAPDHIALNGQVFEQGTPWGDGGYKRGERTISTFIDYVANQLYIANSRNVPLKGVAFDRTSSLGDTIGNDAPGDTPDESMRIEEWVVNGGLWEDGFESMNVATKWGGRRAVNHFHDPLTGAGAYTGFTPIPVPAGFPFVALLRPGMSVTEWVSGGGLIEKNHWGFPTIFERFRLGFSEDKPEKREAAFAAAFRAIGQVQHLVEDNTVPDHARDLPHPGYGFEDYVTKIRPDAFGAFRKPWVVPQTRHVETDGVRMFWDRDVYGRGNPSITLSESDPPGIDEFTNANFFAYNIGLPRPEDPGAIQTGYDALPEVWKTHQFSTIPEFQNQPWQRGGRAPNVVYDWPQLGDHVAPHYLPAQGTLPLNPIACDVTCSGVNSVDKPSWAQYVNPLMARAHGFAQSVLSLVLQPARAEIVTTQDGDELRRVKVRLFNLWPTSGPHSVTWHVDRIVIEPIIIHDQGERDPTPLVIDTPFDVGPGAVEESALSTQLTWKKRQDLTLAAYSAVLVFGHYGTTKQTPFQLAIPVPNALGLIKQTATHDVSPPFSLTTGNCSMASGNCAYDDEIGVYRNPLHQTVTGEITLTPIEVDVLGKKADGELKKALKEDARISEVLLFAWPHDSMRQDFKPVKATASTLTLTGADMGLVPMGAGHWVRTKDAPDVAGPSKITFTADLHLEEFYRNDMGQPLVDASRASGTVYIVVFTTSGGMTLQRLGLWPTRTGELPSAGIGMPCDLDVPRPSWLHEDRVFCSFSGGPVCDTHSHQIQTVFGHSVGALVPPPGLDPFEFGALLLASDDIRPVRFMGMDVPLTGPAKLPTACDTNRVGQLFGTGDGNTVCGIFAPTGMLYVEAHHMDGTATCPLTSRLNHPHTARYRRFFFPEYGAALTNAYGIPQLPPEWEFDMD